MRSILLVSVLTLSLFSSNYSCYSYDTNRFEALKVSEHNQTKLSKLQNIIIRFSHNFTVDDKIADYYNTQPRLYTKIDNRVYLKSSIYCKKYNDAYQCKPSCDKDATDISFDKNYTVRGFKAEFTDYNDLDSYILLKSKESDIKGNIVSCPKELQDLFVCYAHKDNKRGKYYGCQKVPFECKRYNLRSYGQYNTQDKADRAFAKCKE